MTRTDSGEPSLTSSPSTPDRSRPLPGLTSFPAEVAARLDGWSAHVRPEGDLLRGPDGVDLAMTPLRRRPGWRIVPVFTDPALARVAARPALPAAIHLDDHDPARAAVRIARRLLPTAELAVYVRRLDLLLDAVGEAAGRSGRAEQFRNGQRLSGETISRRYDGDGVEFVRDYTAAWPHLDYVLDHAAPVLDRIRLLAPGAAVHDPSLWMPFPALHGMRDLVLEGRQLRGTWADAMSMILPGHPRTQEVRDRAKRLRAKDARPLLDRLDAYQADFATLARAVAIPAEHTHRGLHTPHVLGWEWALAQGPTRPAPGMSGVSCATRPR